MAICNHLKRSCLRVAQLLTTYGGADGKVFGTLYNSRLKQSFDAAAKTDRFLASSDPLLAGVEYWVAVYLTSNLPLTFSTPFGSNSCQSPLANSILPRYGRFGSGITHGSPTW